MRAEMKELMTEQTEMGPMKSASAEKERDVIQTVVGAHVYNIQE